MFKDKGSPRVWRNALRLLFPVLAASLVACRDNSGLSKEAVFFDSPAATEEFFPRAEPETVGIERGALARLVAEAQNTHSNALIVLKDGRVIAERYFNHPGKQPLRINSVTKSIVSLTIGQLIEEGKISGLDTPISRWFPDWAAGKKAKITLRHMLTHTSGLAHDESAAKLYQQSDVVSYARGLPVVDEPGKVFSYSN
ncbi:MAG: serine hydrolase, partial [Elusimicrobia bacterium]|nr:serine hydrolase [Elusimicrobiota bacterium]